MKNIKWINLILELLVVIIGVSIAFSLDSWKESRKAHDTEEEFLISFKYDLGQDIVDFQVLIDTLEVQKQNCRLLIESINNKDFSNERLIDYSISLFFGSNFNPHSATYKSLTSSGQLQSIADFALCKRIVDQYDITYSNLNTLDEFIENQVFNHRIPYLHDNIQYSKGTIVNTDAMQTSKYINISHSAYYFLNKKIEEYQDAKENAEQLILSLDEVLNDI